MLVLSNFFFLYFYSVFPYTYFGFILCYLYYINGTEIIMFRVWGRTFKSNKMLQSTTIELAIPDETRTHKVFMALEQICEEFDLSNPIWLDSNINEFKRIARTRFYADSFVESIDFDYLDFYVIEED